MAKAVNASATMNAAVGCSGMQAANTLA